MYGLVNDSFQQFIELRSAGSWESVAARAGVSHEIFVANEAYDDAITYSLVAAASAELDIAPETLLEEFGAHWILVTARRAYPTFLQAPSLEDFLVRLPSLHARVELSFPHLTPPRFSVRRLEDGAIRLEYRSARAGLQPFVVGLLRGLGTHFGVSADIECTGRKGVDGLDCDVFILRTSQPAGDAT